MLWSSEVCTCVTMGWGGGGRVGGQGLTSDKGKKQNNVFIFPKCLHAAAKKWDLPHFLLGLPDFSGRKSGIS